jgi:hypothetical protein
MKRWCFTSSGVIFLFAAERLTNHSLQRIWPAARASDKLLSVN